MEFYPDHSVLDLPFFFKIEASMAAFLPSKNLLPRKKWRNPWRQSYNKHRKARWQTDSECCEFVKQVLI